MTDANEVANVTALLSNHLMSLIRVTPSIVPGVFLFLFLHIFCQILVICYSVCWYALSKETEYQDVLVEGLNLVKWTNYQKQQ